MVCVCYICLLLTVYLGKSFDSENSQIIFTPPKKMSAVFIKIILRIHPHL